MPNKPAEPSPEVAPTQNRWAFCTTHNVEYLYQPGRVERCPHCKPPAVAPREAQPEIPERPKRQQVFTRGGLVVVMYDAAEMDDYLAALEGKRA